MKILMGMRAIGPVIRSKRRIGDFRFVLQHNFSTFEENKFYDVVISGGGLVGTAMAASIAAEPLFQDKKVLLLEAAPEKVIEKLPEVYYSRTCAINAGSAQLLDSFGAWKSICDMRVQPVHHMQIWDCCSDAMLTFHKDMATDKPLAYIAENEVILSGIVDRLQSMNSNVVQVRHNSKVKGYNLPTSDVKQEANTDQQWAEVIMDDGQILHTRLLIGADGIKSLVRQSANIHTVQWNYSQTAVVATLTLAENGENTTAWQRFLPDGPIAILPLSNKHSCLIWTTSHSHAKELSQMSMDCFVDSINHALLTDEWKDTAAVSACDLINSFTSTLGLRSVNYMDRVPRVAPTVTGVAMETVGSFPLGLGHASHYVKPRMALIGDAAHRVHPLAGQGVNLGFGDVTALVNQLVNAIDIGSDIGSLEHLLAYETERQRVAVPMMAGVDSLNRIYSNRNPLFVMLRSIGCSSLQSLAPVKNLMKNFANN